MQFTRKEIESIYNRTTGYCHLCHKKLSRKNYGTVGARGAWHIDHSKPRSRGGTDHPNNLFPACIQCNCDKSDSATRTARKGNGKTCAPLSPEKRRDAQAKSGIAGAIAGGLAGGALAGPLGAVVGALTGACIGSSQNPDHK